jgi:hypothetical protein
MAQLGPLTPYNRMVGVLGLRSWDCFLCGWEGTPGD